MTDFRSIDGAILDNIEEGRQIPFTLTIEANNESDARTVGERMTDVMDWSLQLVEPRA